MPPKGKKAASAPPAPTATPSVTPLAVPPAMAAWLAKAEGVQLMSDWKSEAYDVISTGDLLIDGVVTGIGGLPRGRIVEVWGPESSGKTTLCCHVCVSAQRAGYFAHFIDVEHAFDMDYFVALGGDPSKLLLSQPDSAEEALQLVVTSCASKMVAVVVVDSVAALTPKAELEGEMSKEFMGLQPRLMGKGMRKIHGIAAKTNTLVLFTNQIRQKIGVMFGVAKHHSRWKRAQVRSLHSP